MGDTLSDSFEQEEGVPQGSIMSPILFELKINSIVNTLRQNVDCSLYVDDFLVCYRSKSGIETIERQLQLQLNKLQEWADLNGFSFSPSKTVAVHFCRKRNCIREPDLYINQKRIEVKEQARFLGVIFDKIHNFHPHIKDLKIRCIKALSAMRVLSNREWGADTTALLHIYRSLVRSKLDYASFVYGNTSPSYISKLDTIHHQGLRLALGAFRTSPVDSLLAEADEPPLALRRKQLALQYALKIGACPDNPAHKYVWNYCIENEILFNTKVNNLPPLGLKIKNNLKNIIKERGALQEIVIPKTPPWTYSRLQVDLELCQFSKTDTNSLEIKQAFMQAVEKYPLHLKIYTDGSKNNEAVGCAFYSNVGTGSLRLHKDTSVFTAEATAIQLALAFAEKKKPRNTLILSDSLSVLTSLSNLYCYDPRIIQIREGANRLLTKGKDISFLWIPSHVGISGNEAVDRLAKEALSSEQVSQEEKIPYTDLRGKAKRLVREEWERTWRLLINNKLKEIKPDLEPRRKSGLKRSEEVVINRIRIGHTALTHRHLLEGQNPPRCVPCNCELTVKHILVECPRLDTVRRQHYGTRDLRELFQRVDSRKILDFLKGGGIFKYV